MHLCGVVCTWLVEGSEGMWKDSKGMCEVSEVCRSFVGAVSRCVGEVFKMCGEVF